MKGLSEFSVDFDEVDGHYYLVHRACHSLEMAVNQELPATSADLLECLTMAREHMKEVHGVDIDNTDPEKCTRKDVHFMVRECSECGFTN